MPIDWQLITAITVPTLISVGICVYLRLQHHGLSQPRQQGIITLVTICCSSLAVLLLTDFPLAGTPLLQMPAAIALLAPLAAVAGLLLSWRGICQPWWLYGSALCALLALVHLVSFPWWNRGVDGWLTLALAILGGCLLGISMRSVGQGHGGRSWCWWAILFLSSMPLLICLTAIGHAQTLFLLAVPLAVAGLVSWLLQIHSFASANPLTLPLLFSTLLGNAAIRYVASPEDPTLITLSLRSMPLLLPLAAACIAGSYASTGKKRSALTLAAVFILLTAVTVSLLAYNYESEAESTTDDPSSFYYQ